MRRRYCAVAPKLQNLVAPSLLQRFKKRCSFAPSLLRRCTKKVQLRGVAVAPLHQKISHLGQVVVYTIYSTFHCRVVAVAMVFLKGAASGRRCCAVAPKLQHLVAPSLLQRFKKDAASRRRCCAVALKRYSFGPSLLRRCTKIKTPRRCGCMYYL